VTLYFIKKKWLRILTFLLTLWILGILIAPLMVISGNKILISISDYLYFFYKPTCHQDPQRSFPIAGHHICVCVRCFAIYLAGLALTVYYYSKKTIKIWTSVRYTLLILPALCDFMLEKVAIYQNIKFVRFGTGIILGIALFHLLIIGTSTCAKPQHRN